MVDNGTIALYASMTQEKEDDLDILLIVEGDDWIDPWVFNHF